MTFTKPASDNQLAFQLHVGLKKMIYNSEKCVNIEERRMNVAIIILEHVNLLKKEGSL